VSLVEETCVGLSLVHRNAEMSQVDVVNSVITKSCVKRLCT